MDIHLLECIEALEKLNALKHELMNMKRKAYQFLESDYLAGYISAISTIEGFLANGYEL